MAVEAQVCSQCGAAVQFSAGQTEVVCSHCGTTVVKAAPGANSVAKELEAEQLIQATVALEKKLHAHGQPATGKIVSAQATDIFRPTIEGRAVLMSFALEVQPEGQAAFPAEAKALIGLVAVDKYRAGILLDVRYDPQNPTQVSIEGRHGVPSSNPEEQAQARRQTQSALRAAPAADAAAPAGTAAWWQELAAQAEPAEPAAAAVPAWGGPRPEGSVPVPVEFDTVTDLGPAVSVHAHADQGLSLLPHFGPPRANVLVLYRDGLTCQAGKALHAWRWDEVAVIVSNAAMHDSDHHVWTTHEYTLTRNSGEKMILDDGVQTIEAAVQQIKPAVFARLLPPLAQAYGAGQALAFGPVTIHQQNGLQLDGKPYAWSAIQDIKVEQGRLTITLRDGKRHEARASAIPNIELLGQLIGLKFYEVALAYF